MPKPELRDHRKFKKLMRLLGERESHCIGYLDCMWHSGYQIGSAYLGDADDVEAAADYPGERGRFAAAALEAGLIDKDETGKYSIHDLYDHAPKYARMRMQRKGNAPARSRNEPEPGTNVTEDGTNVTEHGTFVPENGEIGHARDTKPRAESLEPKAENQEPKAEMLPSEAAAEAAAMPGPTPTEFQTEWNTAAQTHGWRRCDRMTPDREKHYRARLKDPHWRESWRDALRRAGPIGPLRGQNDRNWKASIDWFLKPGTVAKLIEGGYDDWGKERGNQHEQHRTSGLRYRDPADTESPVEAG